MYLFLQDQNPHEVCLFEASFWKSEQVDFGPQEILNFTDDVMAWQQSVPGTDIIILQYG